MKQNNSFPPNINFNKLGARPKLVAPNANILAENVGANTSLLQDSYWKCKGGHYTKYCPNKTHGVVPNLSEDPIVEYMASTPRIYEELSEWQEDHQATMIEI